MIVFRISNYYIYSLFHNVLFTFIIDKQPGSSASAAAVFPIQFASLAVLYDDHQRRRSLRVYDVHLKSRDLQPNRAWQTVWF